MILINGNEVSNISVYDRGLQFGDGLFETMRLDNASISSLSLHLDRLKRGCETLKIPFPDMTALKNELDTIIDGQDNAVVKIVITRGQSERGYKIPTDIESNRIIYLATLPTNIPQLKLSGIDTRLCETRMGLNPRLAGIKHLNRLEQVMARLEWHNEAIFEGIMRDINDHIVEGVMTNLFIVQRDTLITPLLDQCGVAGIMRQRVMKRANSLGIRLVERRVVLDDLLQADEMFMTNAVFGMIPVNSIENIKQFSQQRPIYTRLDTCSE